MIPRKRVGRSRQTITVQFKEHCPRPPLSRCACVPASQTNGPAAKAPGPGQQPSGARSWRPPAPGPGPCYVINPWLRGAALPSQPRSGTATLEEEGTSKTTSAKIKATRLMGSPQCSGLPCGSFCLAGFCLVFIRTLPAWSSTAR